MATHELKTWPRWFEMVRSGRKLFELRVNDRNYQCGDTLILREWEPETEIYTGSEERRVLADIIDLSPLYECVALVFMDDASDTLRAQLAAAKKHAEYQDKEIRQWANVCYVGTWPLSEDDTKNTGFYGRMAAKMTAERNAATARAEKAEAERDALAARVAELDGVMSAYFNGYMLDEAEDEDICVDGERQHLRARAVGDALARTPAQSLASCKAAALREAAKECQEIMPDDLPHLTYSQLMEMAERLEAEAANGPQ